MGYNFRVPSARDPEAIYRVFGRKLRAVRERKQLPQQELATLSGLTRASIANIESGRQRVLLHQLVQFAEALQVELGEIVPTVAEMSTDHDPADPFQDYLRLLRETILADVTETLRREEFGINEKIEKDS